MIMIDSSIMGAIKSRRSIRNFEDRPVSESAISTILEAATYAPTAVNMQPWKFTLIANKNKMKKLSDLAKPALISVLPDGGNEAFIGLKRKLSDSQFNVFYDAPLLVFVAGVKTPFSIYDCSMAVQNMMLAAFSIGLGSCWIGSAVTLANDPQIKAELGIPDDHQVYSAVIFGYPKAQPNTPQKRPPVILKRID